MWSEIFSAIKNIIVLNEQTQQNKEDIKDLRRDFKDLENQVQHLTSLVTLLAQDNLRLRDEIRNAREQEAKERENLGLRLENEMLRFERRLPSGETKKNGRIIYMKKKILIVSFAILCLFAINPETRAQGRSVEPQVKRDALLKADALHNLDVAEQYFIKKRHKAVLMRLDEIFAVFPDFNFSRMDEVLYLAAMSSRYMAEGRTKQKIDLAKVSDDERRKYAPETLRENAVAYLTKLVSDFPQSARRAEAEKVLKELEAKK